MSNRTELASALQDFHQAHRRAALEGVLGQLTGKSIELLSYESVVRQLRSRGTAARTRQEIPLDAIVGTVGRYGDFSRNFLPLQASDSQRWASLKAYTETSPVGWPPIEVYQVGGSYFVLDGHHRVSIARRMGMMEIEAYVTEVRTRAPLPAGARPEDVIIMAEYAAFLEQTELDRERPGLDLRVSIAGQYRHLLDQIAVQQYVLGQQRGREATLAEAAASWYDEVYLPVATAMRQQDLLREFPDRTETDLYLWVVSHRAALEKEAGRSLQPQVAMADLARGFTPAGGVQRWLSLALPERWSGEPATGQWRRDKLADRYTDCLFGDVLVAFSGQAGGWQALDQALVVAERERGRVHGLRVGPAEPGLTEAFAARCQARGLEGGLRQVESDDVTGTLCAQARLSDLVVFHLAHPPGGGLASGVRQIIQHSPRPLLAARGAVIKFERALVAYDGSPKAREALFAAAYLAEAWGARLVVLAVRETAVDPQPVLDYARAYAEMHEVEALLVERAGPTAAAITAAAAEADCDLIVMGGYSASPLVEWINGSALDGVLRQSDRPVLICR